MAVRKTIHFPCRTPPAHTQVQASVHVPKPIGQQISPRLVPSGLAASEGVVDLPHGAQQHIVQRGMSCETRLLSSVTIQNALENVQLQAKRSSFADRAGVATHCSLRSLSPAGLYQPPAKTLYDVPRSPPMRAAPRGRLDAQDAQQRGAAPEAALQEAHAWAQAELKPEPAPAPARYGRSPRGAAPEPLAKPGAEQIWPPLKSYALPPTTTPPSHVRSLSPTSVQPQLVACAADAGGFPPDRSPSWEPPARAHGGEQIWPPPGGPGGPARSATSTPGSVLRTLSPHLVQSRCTRADAAAAKVNPPLGKPDRAQVATASVRYLDGIDENEASACNTDGGAGRRSSKGLRAAGEEGAAPGARAQRGDCAARPGRASAERLSAILEAQNARLEAQNMCLEARNKSLEMVVTQLLERVGCLEERFTQ